MDWIGPNESKWTEWPNGPKWIEMEQENWSGPNGLKCSIWPRHSVDQRKKWSTVSHNMRENGKKSSGPEQNIQFGLIFFLLLFSLVSLSPSPSSSLSSLAFSSSPPISLRRRTFLQAHQLRHQRRWSTSKVLRRFRRIWAKTNIIRFFLYISSDSLTSLLNRSWWQKFSA